MEFGGKNYNDVELNGWLYKKAFKEGAWIVKREKTIWNRHMVVDCRGSRGCVREKMLLQSFLGD